MQDETLFIELARQLGHDPAEARAALEWARARLAAAGLARARYYVYRSGGTSGGGAGTSARPRLLLAFPSADAALGFAQSQRLGAAPRLAGLSLGQALAACLQRPAIGALYFADESQAAAHALPGGVRIERAELLGRLAGGAISSAEDGQMLV